MMTAMNNTIENSTESIIRVQGELLTVLPKDLYIPPDALEIFLETFQGPLDLLLYLIKKQNMDILDIPMMSITEQYMVYVEVMKDLHLELAAEYLVMAAMLAEIKSRMLLPRPAEEEGDEDDPRADLVRRLQEYERFKVAAQELDELPQEGRDVFLAKAKPPEFKFVRPLPQIDFNELLLVFHDVMQRAQLHAHHSVMAEPLSVRDRMSAILARVSAAKDYVEFTAFFTVTEGKLGVVVTFSAILELLKESILDIVQAEPYSPIYVKARVIMDAPIVEDEYHE